MQDRLIKNRFTKLITKNLFLKLFIKIRFSKSFTKIRFWVDYRKLIFAIDFQKWYQLIEIIKWIFGSRLLNNWMENFSIQFLIVSESIIENRSLKSIFKMWYKLNKLIEKLFWSNLWIKISNKSRAPFKIVTLKIHIHLKFSKTSSIFLKSINHTKKNFEQDFSCFKIDYKNRFLQSILSLDLNNLNYQLFSKSIIGDWFS